MATIKFLYTIYNEFTETGGITMIAAQFHEITTLLDTATTKLTEIHTQASTIFEPSLATPMLKKMDVLQDLLNLLSTSNMNTKLLIAGLRHSLLEAGIILVKLTDALNVDTVATYQILELVAVMQTQLAMAKKKVGDDLVANKVIND